VISVKGSPGFCHPKTSPELLYQYISTCSTDEIYDTDGDGQADSDGLCESFDEDIIAIAEGYRQRSICTNVSLPPLFTKTL
jgi:hypothetical protein